MDSGNAGREGSIWKAGKQAGKRGQFLVSHLKFSIWKAGWDARTIPDFQADFPIEFLYQARRSLSVQPTIAHCRTEAPVRLVGYRRVSGKIGYASNDFETEVGTTNLPPSEPLDEFLQ